MPMNWNAENETKLFALILRHADVKVGTDVIKAVALEMGPDCTPKAITHRIAKIKAAANLPTSTTGATAASTDPAASTAADTPATPKKAKTPKKPAAKPAAGTPRGRKRNKEATPARASEAGDDSEPGVGCESPTKKVKREEGVDGEGDEDAI